MPDLFDFLPLRVETRDRIRARVDAAANAGLVPSDAAWLDTTEGGFFWDATQPAVLELERLWDALSVELPAVTFLPFAYGRYLDRYGDVYDVARKAASRASGAIRFSGADGTLVPTNAEVAVPGTGEDEPTVYTTTESGTIAGGFVDVQVQAEEEGTAGNAVPNAATLLLSAIPGVSSVTNPTSLTGGTDVESDEQYLVRLLQVFRGANGSGTMDDYEQWATDYAGVGFATIFPEDPAPGFVRVVVTDSLNDPVSDTIRDGLKTLLDPPSYTGALSGSHTFPQGTVTVDSTVNALDEGYLLVDNSQVLRYTGKTATTFTGVTGGTGTYPDGTVVEQSGRGQGLAPVGHRVLVQTPAQALIDVQATVELEAGYSLDGTGATTAVREALEDVVGNYVNGLRPGADVILNRVESVLFKVRGVHDTGSVQIRIPPAAFAAANIAIGTLQVPQLGTITLTEV